MGGAELAGSCVALAKDTQQLGVARNEIAVLELSALKIGPEVVDGHGGCRSEEMRIDDV